MVSEANHVDESPQRLTWMQIRERYPDRWVVLVDTAWANEDDLEIDNAIATVVCHFESRSEASPHIKAAFERHQEVGSFWTGG